MFSVYLTQKIPSHHLLVQVVSDELQAVDREPDPEPELCYLGMSVQVGFIWYGVLVGWFTSSRNSATLGCQSRLVLLVTEVGWLT